MERVARLKARNPGQDDVWEAAAPYVRFTTKENGRSIIPREAVPGALAWAREATARLDFPKAGRNEPCPCGSGKKHKKCGAG